MVVPQGGRQEAWSPAPGPIFCLYPREAPHNIEAGGADWAAFHGLQPFPGGSPYIDTWTREDGTCWLRDSLPSDLHEGSKLNVFSFALNLPALDRSCSITLPEVAAWLDQLLPSALATGQSGFHGLGCNDRPVVLVGHSFGGIVTKSWVVQLAEQARQPGLRSQVIHKFLRNIDAIIFMATPHLGAATAKAARAILPLHSSEFTKLLGGKPAAGKSLNDLADLFESEVQAVYTIPVMNIYETSSVTKGMLAKVFGLGVKVVNQDSATQHEKWGTSVAAQADHSQVARLDPKGWPYGLLLKWVQQPREQRIKLPVLMRHRNRPSAEPRGRLHFDGPADTETAIAQATLAMQQAGMHGLAVASQGQSVVVSIGLTAIQNHPGSPFDRLWEAMSSLDGSFQFQMITERPGGPIHEEGRRSPRGSCKRILYDAPSIAQATIVSFHAASSKLQGDASWLVVVEGGSLTQAALHAHASGQYVQLEPAAASIAEEVCATGLDCRAFIIPADLQCLEHIVLEATINGTWSRPFPLPLNGAVVQDGFGEIADCLSAEDQAGLEACIGGFLGGHQEDVQAGRHAEDDTSSSEEEQASFGITQSMHSHSSRKCVKIEALGHVPEELHLIHRDSEDEDNTTKSSLSTLHEN